MRVMSIIAMICHLIAVIIAVAALLGAPLPSPELLVLAFVAGGLLADHIPLG